MVRLAPLGAYKLLGPAVSEIGESIVGLEDIAGADASRLSERVRIRPDLGGARRRPAHLTREFRRFTGTTPGALITA